MNVLNVSEIEREISLLAARARYPEVKRWAMTVARNHIISNLPEKDVMANYRIVTLDPDLTDETKYRIMELDELPPWAKEALNKGNDVPAQPVRWSDAASASRSGFFVYFVFRHSTTVFTLYASQYPCRFYASGVERAQRQGH